MEWTPGIEHTLDLLRLNCVSLSEYHRKLYERNRSRSNFSRTPILILTFINAYVAVGLKRYIEQENVTDINCGISLFIGLLIIVQSIFKYQTKMEQELLRFKEYYVLSAKIFKVLSTPVENRKVNGKYFLEETFKSYETLVVSSNIIQVYKDDLLDQPDTIVEQTDVTADKGEWAAASRKLYDHWNILYQPKLRMLKKENTSILRALFQTNTRESVPTTEDENTKESVNTETDEIKEETKPLETQLDLESQQTDTAVQKETDQTEKASTPSSTIQLPSLYNPFSYDIFNTGFLKEQLDKDQIELTKMRKMVNEELRNNKATKSSMSMRFTASTTTNSK
jgi:hypothetical protein